MAVLKLSIVKASDTLYKPLNLDLSLRLSALCSQLLHSRAVTDLTATFTAKVVMPTAVQAWTLTSAAGAQSQNATASMRLKHPALESK